MNNLLKGPNAKRALLSVLSEMILKTTSAYWSRLSSEEKCETQSWFCSPQVSCDPFRGISLEYICAELRLSSAYLRELTAINNRPGLVVSSQNLKSVRLAQTLYAQAAKEIKGKLTAHSQVENGYSNACLTQELICA